MKKKSMKQSTILNFKGFLIFMAFAIWVYIIMNIDEEIRSIETYAGSVLIVSSILYILIILLEFFVDIKNLDK